MTTMFNLADHLDRQRRFSYKTFGPPNRRGYEGVIDHLRKEIEEVTNNPEELDEWVDLIILAFDGAMRAPRNDNDTTLGYSPEEIIYALEGKQRTNEKRSWPDWRTSEPGKAIEHEEEEKALHEWVDSLSYHDDWDDAYSEWEEWAYY